MTPERRRFSRILFNASAQLLLPSGELAVDVLDLSLKGAMVRPQTPAYVQMGTHGLLKIRLDDTASTIRMEITIVHHQGDLYGLACREIDLDSMTHLRRLIELNLGDEDLLNREIQTLTANAA
ncbi:MAG TPA: PilZ domain-containing protein [Rhodocyclaceae bacterium]|nr:PilZ domain-containing protein [Rhodocyclaceae bacterium]